MTKLYGVNTSLYITLSANQVSALEQAIFCSITGQYSTARSIFENDLSDVKTVPVVAIERAVLAYNQGRQKEAWETLEVALKDPCAKHIEHTCDDASRRLMKIFHALAAIKHQGTLEPALREILAVREWLLNTPIASYTDIQANIIRLYCTTSYFVSIYAKHDESDVALVPISNEPETPWRGLTDLRMSLLQRGMIFEALALLKVERWRVPFSDRLATISSFAFNHSDHSLSDIQSLWIELELCYLTALTYQELEEYPKAKEELNRMESLLNKWCDATGFPDKDRHVHSINNKYVDLQLMDDDDHHGRYEKSLELLRDTEASEHYRTGWCLYIAGNAARQIALLDDKPEMYRLFLDLRKREEEYEEMVLGDLPDLVHCKLLVLLDAARNGVDVRKALEWIDGFSEQYPSFLLPSVLNQLHQLRALLLTAVGEMEQAARVYNIIENLTHLLPAMNGPLIGVRPEKTQPICPNDTDETRLGEERIWGKPKIGSLEEENFWVDWKDSHLDRVEQRRTAMRLLSKWIIQDLQEGLFPFDCAMDIFGLDEGQRKATVNAGTSAALQSMSTQTYDALLQSLYFQVSNQRQEMSGDSSSPDFDKEGPSTESVAGQVTLLSVESWGSRLAALTNWLKCPSRSTVTGRQSLLLMLQDIRIQLFGYEVRFYDQVVTECERALNIMEGLHKPVKDYFSMHRISWQSNVADFSLGVCEYSSSEQLLAEKWEYVEKAEQYCAVSIDEHRKAKNLGSVAFCQRSMARIYLMKLHKVALQQKDDFKSLEKLRDSGLSFLRQADEYFDRAELEASWVGGLEGFNSRQHVTKSHVPLLSTQVALSLLMEGNTDPDEFVRTAMWEWVQKAKGQSLVSTMGLNREDPPSMVERIEQVDLLKSMYHQLNIMRSMILQASLRDRYHLRQELDSYIQEMKQHELLKRLFDAREGKHLSADDLMEISGQTDCDTVFVDWFYLPGFLSDMKPVLLMFTRRAGSAPTVDILTTKSKDIFEWISTYIDDKSTLRDPLERQICVPKMSSLVEPLSRRTKPGDLLVLCPTDVLHRIPLHALDVKDVFHGTEIETTLIHRNPVVYIHSHSLLRPCCWASRSAAESKLKLNPIFVNGASYEEGKFQPNYADGHEAVQSLSKRYSCLPALHSAEATKAGLLDSLHKTRLVHIQSHCKWDNSRPLEHSIVFPRPPAQPAPTDSALKVEIETEHSNQDPYTLTARECFSLHNKICLGTHLNLLICSGALTRLNPGDEAFGLIPALLYSGAASTVSTLWDMDDEYAAKFSRTFYQAMSEYCQQLGFDDSTAGEGKWVNIAKIVQQALKKMDLSQTAPLAEWSGFLMHGYWMMWIGANEGKSFCGTIIDAKKEQEVRGCQ